MEFAENAISTQELLQLTEEERKFVLAASFMMNDIRFHWSQLARSPIDGVDGHLMRMQKIRQLWGARKLAGVVIEAQITIGHFIGKFDFLKIYVMSNPIFSKQNLNSKCWPLARRLRNETAYHYLPEKLAQNLSGFSEDEMHRHYAHVQHGNSICTLGEQIFTLPIVLNELGENGLNIFCDWIDESSNAILDFCNNVLATIFLERFPDKNHTIIEIGCLETLPISHRWPLFLEI